MGKKKTFNLGWYMNDAVDQFYQHLKDSNQLMLRWNESVNFSIETVEKRCEFSKWHVNMTSEYDPLLGYLKAESAVYEGRGSAFPGAVTHAGFKARLLPESHTSDRALRKLKL